MMNIIKADVYRLFKGKAIYISLIVIAIMSIFSVIAMQPGHIGLSTNVVSMESEITNEELMEKLENANTFSEIRKITLEYGSFLLDKEIIATNVNLYYFFIVIVVVILVSDLSNSTAKNSLSSSISRRKYYFSKLITCLIFSTGIILFNNLFVYVLNYFINGTNFVSNLSEIIKITLYQLPLMYGIISLLVMISFASRKTSIFNGISIPFLMIVQLGIIGISTLFRIDTNSIMQYEFQYALASLVTNPTNNYILKCAGLGLLYFIVFNIIGYTIFKKSEIK